MYKNKNYKQNSYTNQQIISINALNQILTEKKDYENPFFKELIISGTDINSTLNRFLIARKYDVIKAYKMLIECMKWREINGLYIVIIQI